MTGSDHRRLRARLRELQHTFTNENMQAGARVVDD